ncbi:MAG: HlyD family efflux transporter periplasmic adaptor subunit [Alphaproteobacteria bacterium]|nr:HlyD family efflux transporter periplasmic adaptor subunit [Alphaproteobacteria bacterium]
MTSASIRRLAIAIVLGAGFVALLIFLFQPDPIPVETALVRKGMIRQSVSDQGIARASDAFVVSAPVSGRLERLTLKPGDRVAAGETVVARLRPAQAEFLDPRSRAQAEARVAAAEASALAAQSEVNRTKAELQRAQSNYDRVRRLADRGTASIDALESAETAAKVAEDQVSAAEASLKARIAELDAARAALIGPMTTTGEPIEILAPVSGFIRRVFQESERVVPAGTSLLEISDPHAIEAAIDFLSEDAVLIREGQPAEIYDWGGPSALGAVVRRVEPQGFTKVSALGVEEQRVTVVLQISQPRADWQGLGPGYRVWGRVILRQNEDALLVPLGSLIRDAGGWAVFHVVDGHIVLTRIEIGAVSGQAAEILTGLKEGDEVVQFPSDRVKPGVLVETQRSEGRP